MAQEPERIEMIAPMDSWLKLIERSKGGIPIGELTLIVGHTGTGKSMISQYVANQIKQEQENGI